jgi:hypothetical protein
MPQRTDAETRGAGTIMLVVLTLAIVAGLSTPAPDANPANAFSIAFAAPSNGVRSESCRARSWVGAIVSLHVVPPDAADHYNRLAACTPRDETGRSARSTADLIV